MALPAASENVLVAVDSCTFDRLPLMPGHIASRTRPRLSVDEVTTILGLLVGDGYLEAHRDLEYEGSVDYEMTGRGKAHLESLW